MRYYDDGTYYDWQYGEMPDGPLPYRKRKRKASAPRSDHKHEYRDTVVVWTYLGGRRRYELAKVCPICGKVRPGRPRFHHIGEDEARRLIDAGTPEKHVFRRY